MEKSWGVCVAPYSLSLLKSESVKAFFPSLVLFTFIELLLLLHAVVLSCRKYTDTTPQGCGMKEEEEEKPFEIDGGLLSTLAHTQKLSFLSIDSLISWIKI